MKIEAQPGDLFLFTKARGMNKLITWFSQSPWYHVAIYAGGPFVVEARPRGVVRRDLRGPDGDKDFQVVPAPCKRSVAVQALHNAESHIGKGYDPLNVIALVLDRALWAKIPSINNERWSCGELVTDAFRNAGFDPLPGMEAEDVLPSDFARYLPPDSPVYHGAHSGHWVRDFQCEWPGPSWEKFRHGQSHQG